MIEDSRILGKLMGESEACIRQRTEIFTQLHRIKAEMVTRAELEDIKLFIEDYKYIKAKVAGVILVISAVAAFGMSYIESLLK